MYLKHWTLSLILWNWNQNSNFQTIGPGTGFLFYFYCATGNRTQIFGKLFLNKRLELGLIRG
jgi:hypothetical protein